jgi:hypothetical protein
MDWTTGQLDEESVDGLVARLNATRQSAEELLSMVMNRLDMRKP